MRQVDRVTAASVLGLSPDSLDELVGAGLLAARRACTGDLLFRPADLEAFAERNRRRPTGPVDLAGRPAGAGRPVGATPGTLDVGELLEVLSRRAESMALRMLRMYVAAFPEAAAWDTPRQLRFVAATRDRLAAILDVAAAGPAPGDELSRDLGSVGAAAAESGASLPELLAQLRMSRDLVVHNAVDIVERDGRPGGFALSLLLTRLLAATDRLADAVAAGYWEAMPPS